MRPPTHNQSSLRELRHQKAITCAIEPKCQHKSDRHKHTHDTTKQNRKAKNYKYLQNKTQHQ